MSYKFVITDLNTLEQWDRDGYQFPHTATKGAKKFVQDYLEMWMSDRAPISVSVVREYGESSSLPKEVFRGMISDFTVPRRNKFKGDLTSAYST